MTQDNIQRSLGRLEEGVRELQKSVTYLTNEFRTLESGRLSKLERDFIEFQTTTRQTAHEAVEKAKDRAFWTGVVVSAWVSLLVTVLSGLILYFVFHVKP